MLKEGIENQNPQINEDLYWIKQAKQRPEDFRPLYEKYHGRIYIFIYNRMNDKELAKDVTSQVFVKAIKHIASFVDKGYPFSSWLYRIAKNEVYQHFRDNPSDRFVHIESKFISDLKEAFAPEQMISS